MAAPSDEALRVFVINSRLPWGLQQGGVQSVFTITLVTIGNVPAPPGIPGALRVLGCPGVQAGPTSESKAGWPGLS